MSEEKKGKTDHGAKNTHNKVQLGDKLFQCRKCGKCLSSEVGLRRHINREKKGKQFKCSTCDRRFSMEARRDKHQRKHLGIVDILYSCEFCPKTFVQSNHFTVHMKGHHIGKPVKSTTCKICHKVLASTLSLKNHQKVHTGEKPHKCKTCGAQFTQSHSLNRHQVIHSGEKPFKCCVCKKSFNQFGTLKRHREIHTGENSYECPKCKKVFSQKAAMILHDKKKHKTKPSNTTEYLLGRQNMNKENIKGVICSLCKQKFKGRSMIKRYKVHDGDETFQCRKCDKCYSICKLCNRQYEYGTKKEHYKIHFGDKPLQCRKCGICFSRLDCLMRHIRKEMERNQFKCSTCDLVFSTEVQRDTHQNKHLGYVDKTYSCEHCPRTFTQSNLFRMHMKSAHNGKPKEHVCKVCNKVFANSFSLKSHQTVHTGEKPHKCETCGAQFTQSHSLRRHQLIHSGEKPFKCSVCKKSFNQFDTLKRHEEIHTGENAYKCSKCKIVFSQKAALKLHQRKEHK
ncbi:zinc finger protein (C2H2)-145 [Ciona intestinalis]